MCQCCDCSDELAAMRERMRLMSEERSALYRQLARCQVHWNGVSSIIRRINERTREADFDTTLALRAAGWLILTTALKGIPDMTPPVLTYVVTKRNMLEMTNPEAPGHPPARQVNITLTVADVDRPAEYPPIVFTLHHEECKLAAEFPLGARYELRKVETALPELPKKVDITL